VVVDRFPTYYISHGGGPCFFMPDPRGAWTGLGNFLAGLPRNLKRLPSAVLVVSAHWETPVVTIGSAPRPDLIYDYYGFPDHTYEIEYRAPGSPEVARRAGEVLARVGLEHRIDPTAGWDHGVFIPMKVMFPDADVPIVAMSLRHDLDPAHHLEIGRALTDLRSDVLIIGSGSSYHNLSDFSPLPAERFDRWLGEVLPLADQTRSVALTNWRSAPSAIQAHPREEHLVPLMVAVGAAETEHGEAVFRGPVLGVTMSCWRFGDH
jgi:aromatic ring-opening dioxygenase catalytic subunit (LigB family)